MSNELLSFDEQAKLEDTYYTKIGMCGCGDEQAVKRFILELLQLQDKRNEYDYHTLRNEMHKVIEKTHKDTIFEFVFHTLDNADILEHGSSVYGAWLTDSGKEFLQLLERDLQEYKEEQPQPQEFVAKPQELFQEFSEKAPLHPFILADISRFSEILLQQKGTKWQIFAGKIRRTLSSIKRYFGK